jgi:hypothetical protein
LGKIRIRDMNTCREERKEKRELITLEALKLVF